ncbi:alpha-amylase family protein [Gilvimarinus chinensis]|uniref:alpha-amylase family protein n=1 Tax=Gilvimarinus chinensis TaxID=396005 RepID=UPI00035FEE97|nr:alpha-amylase family protein [Gilvimarinus chinensis]
MSKKLLVMALAGVLPLALAACSNDEPASVSPATNVATLEQMSSSSINSPYVKEAEQKISTLQAKMQDAKSQNIDITREETVVWFAKEFLKFADWDEANRDAVAYAFAQYAPYADRSEKLADEIPDFQRKKVIDILDDALVELDQVITGQIKRRPVPKVDWQNITVADNKLLSNGKPIFLYDYFSKSVGRPLTDTAVYNDHLGAIYHGGENLYPVDHDRAINSFLLNEDGSFDEELLREVTEIDNSNVGFLIYWNMGIPEWVEAREPEVRKGRSLFTGYDIDNPLVREVWGTIAKETGKLTQGKRVTQLGYILANEPHWYSEAGHWSQNFQEMNDISSYTLAHFREWLKEKYAGNIAPLNTNWKTEFASFDEVSIGIPIDPETRGTPVWYDWSRFNMDRSIDWFTFLQGQLKEGNPEADTHIKIMPNMYSENNRSHGIDVEALTELTTMIGDDAKARESRLLNHKKPEKWEAHYSMFWEEMSMSYDFMESVSPEKIHVNSESHFLSASWWRDLDTSIDYVNAIYWLATLQGMDANMAWFWARDPDGSFEDRLEGELDFFDPALAGSFAGSVNQQPHVANAFTQVMYDLNSFAEEIIQLREQRRPLRLFHSETSAINKSFHMSEQFSIYEKLFFDGFPVGFATQNIIQKQDNDLWDTVLVYKTEFVTRAELAALQQYLDNGGTVIVDSPESLSKDEYGQPHSVALTGPKDRLIQLSGDESLEKIRELALETVKESLPKITLRENNGTEYKGVRWQAIAQQGGGYLVSAINLGKNDATLTLNLEGGGELSVVDMLTQQPVASKPVLAPKGVALWQVRAGQ